MHDSDDKLMYSKNSHSYHSSHPSHSSPFAPRTPLTRPLSPPITPPHSGNTHTPPRPVSPPRKNIPRLDEVGHVIGYDLTQEPRVYLGCTKVATFSSQREYSRCSLSRCAEV